MITFRNIFITIFLLISFSCTVLASDFRIFTDQQDRKIEAKITRVSRPNVYIERRDGLNTKSDISIFSLEDQKYIHEWDLRRLVKDKLLEIRLSRKLTDENEYESDGIIYNESNMYFEFIISNNSQDRSFEDLRIDYLILKFEDKLSTKKRNWGDILRIKGNTHVGTIDTLEELRIPTEKFSMLEAQVAPDSPEISGRQHSKDDIRGIWLKIYIGDLLVHEMSKPGNIMQIESWDEKPET